MQPHILLLNTPIPQPHQRPLGRLTPQTPQTLPRHRPYKILPQIHLLKILMDQDVLVFDSRVALFGFAQLGELLVALEGVDSQVVVMFLFGGVVGGGKGACADLE